MTEDPRDPRDERLRAAFGALKRADAARAPSFDEIRRRAPAPRRISPLRIALAAAPPLALAAAVLLWVRTQGGDAATASAPAAAPAAGAPADDPSGGGAVTRRPALARAELPLDFLLDAPGASLLRAAPAIDRARGSALPSPPRSAQKARTPGAP